MTTRTAAPIGGPTVGEVTGLKEGVVRPAEDSPCGRLAPVTVPTGAQFALISPS